MTARHSLLGDGHSYSREPPDGPTGGASEAPKAAGISWGWRVALFLWATAFLCLLAYELLNTLVRSLSRMF